MAIVCEERNALERIVKRLDEVMRDWGLFVSPKRQKFYQSTVTTALTFRT